MEYKNIIKGTFIDRPNRFVAIVKINCQNHKVHVKNTGRCKELLLPGATVYLQDFTNNMGTRKLAYSLIAVEKNHRLINMDSLAPNKVVYEGLQSAAIKLPGMENLTTIKSEFTYEQSRFDFYVEDDRGGRGFIEVKGVTLEVNNKAIFPDAPTARGTKHLKHLMKALSDGYKSYIIFLIQIRGVSCFSPNYSTDPLFSKTLEQAVSAGVKVLSFDCFVTETSLSLGEAVPINLIRV